MQFSMFTLYPPRVYVSDGTSHVTQSAQYTQEYESVRQACVKVLSRMPKDEAQKLIDTCLVSWVSSPGSSCTKVLERPAAPRRAIWLDPRLPCYSEEMRVGIVAHEFAHVVCNHRTADGSCEQEADRLAAEWGFSAEIEAMRAYIHTGGGELAP